MKFYRDLPPYVSPSMSIFIMQQGDSYVVEDPSFQERLELINGNSETTMIDVASQKRAVQAVCLYRFPVRSPTEMYRNV